MASNLIIMEKIGADTSYVDIVAPAGIYNSNLVQLSTRNANGTYQASAPTGIADKSLVMVLHEDLGYNSETVNMNDITFATGAILRAAHLREGDEIAIPVANVLATATVQADNYLIPDATKLPLECVASLGGTEAFAMIITDTFTKAGVSMLRARVIEA